MAYATSVSSEIGVFPFCAPYACWPLKYIWRQKWRQIKAHNKPAKDSGSNSKDQNKLIFKQKPLLVKRIITCSIELKICIFSFSDIAKYL
jgi:hypothetical protein